MAHSSIVLLFACNEAGAEVRFEFCRVRGRAGEEMGDVVGVWPECAGKDPRS